MIFNAHYVESMHFGNILIQENKFYGSWIIFSYIVDEYWHLCKLNYVVFNSYSSE
jgi:hypothetical protein